MQLAAAVLALSAQRPAAAEAALDRALAADANNTEALLRKGTLQFERADVQGAIATFTKLIEVMPGNIVGRTRRADAYMRLGRTPTRCAMSRRRCARHPARPPRCSCRAMLHVRAQEWQPAPTRSSSASAVAS